MDEEQQPEQPQMRSMPYQSPMWNYGGSIVMLTNPENVLHSLELTLRNLNINEQGETVQAGPPLLNESGVSSVMGIIQSIVNQVTIMSNLGKNDIPMLMEFLGDTMVRDLMVNRVNYAITASSSRDKIFFTTLSTGFICMRRAFEGDDKRFWKGSQQEITTRIEGARTTNKGLVRNLLGWNK